MPFSSFLSRLGLGLLLASPACLPAQTTPAGAAERLEAATVELSTLRAQIAAERVPLAAELRRLETEVLELRRERERRQRLVDNQSLDLTNLEAQAKAFEDESAYVLNLLGDYLNRANASLAVAEVPRFGPAFLDILNRAGQSGQPAATTLALQLEGLALGFTFTEATLGGHRFEGSAVLPDGRVAPGSFAQVGPIGYFASDPQNAGIIARGASEQPALLIFDPSSTATIHAFVQSGSGPLPIDPTLGRALAIATAQETFVEHFLKGGLWMWPIATFGLIALIVSAFKLLDILSIKPFPEDGLQKVFSLLREGRRLDALHYVKSLSGPGADMVMKGLENLTLPVELIEEFLFESILSVKPKLERGIAFITLTASVSPLLGLLGTVTGMIETFKLLTLFGTGDAKSLSSGISQALITTEFGLIAAIPALILAALISRNVSGKLARLDRLMVSYANGLAALKAHGIPPEPASTPASTPSA